MTEQEWLSSTDPQAMLRSMEMEWDKGATYSRISDRKLRLFACACVRQVWHLLEDARSLMAAEIVEQYVDGLTSQAEFDAAALSAGNARRESPYCPWNEQTPDQQKDMAALAACELFQPSAIAAARNTARLTDTKTVQAVLLRTIVGNPYRPVASLYRVCWNCYGSGCDSCQRLPGHAGIRPVSPWLTHADGRVHKMAQVIYDERRWELMPMLADALEEAGCRDETMLKWCRGQEVCPNCLEVRHWPKTTFCCNDTGWIPRRAPSVRGDWVIDLLIGRE